MNNPGVIYSATYPDGHWYYGFSTHIVLVTLEANIIIF